MPFTTIAEFTATETPTDAELALIAACRAGTDLTLPIDTTNATLPPEGEATPDRAIRAELLRLLIIGGSPECGLHSSGLWLEGAHITGMLDLRFAKAIGRCALVSCRFDEKPRLDQAHFAELSLDGSHLPGLFAQGITVTGSIFLNNLIATGTVDLNGARITGQLTCTGSTLNGGKVAVGNQQWALNAQGAQVGADLSLRNLSATGTVDVSGAKITGQLSCTGAKLDGGKDANGNQQRALQAQGAQVGAGMFLNDLTATGTVDVNGAKITGQLACTGATLDGGKNADGNQQWALNAQGAQIGAGLFLSNLTAKGTVAVVGAEIKGQMICTGATLDGGKDAKGNQQEALNGQRLHVGQSFFFRNLKSVSGQVYLDAAHVGDLVDDAASWPMGTDQLYLNGFTYDRIADGPLTLAGRKNWLAKGSRYKGEFYPHPYTQFARVLRDMGHAAEARKVLMERDRLLFAESHAANRATLKAARTENKGDVGKEWLRYYLTRFWSWFSFYASGYGHAPQRALFVSLACIGIGALLFFAAWQAGVMVPNSAIILTSPDWLNAMTTNPNAPSAAWTQLAPGKHFETFYSLPYALDVFVPFVSLGQENAWAATTTNGFGKFIRWFTFAYQIIGWAITALGIASITGLVQKNQPD